MFKRPRPASADASLPGVSVTLPSHHLEALEPRVLLTTLVGGDIFEFRAPDPNSPDGLGPTIRVVVEGETILELIGADIGAGNILDLGDIPGRLYGFNGRIGTGYTGGADVLGGVGGLDGVAPVTLNDLFGAPTPIIDPSVPQYSRYPSRSPERSGSPPTSLHRRYQSASSRSRARTSGSRSCSA